MVNDRDSNPNAAALAMHRRLALFIVANDNTSLVSADTIAAVVLPHLTPGARWSHVDSLRKLHERYVALACRLKSPSSLRRPGESTEDHHARDTAAAKTDLEEAVTLALDEEERISRYGTGWHLASIPRQRQHS